jgi:tetratricopeptide (TPR) repeat protein
MGLLATVRALILLVLLASAAAQAGEKPSYTSARYGFRISAPTAGWKIDTLPEAKPGVFAVLLRARTDGTGLTVDVQVNEPEKPQTADEARRADLDFMKGKPQYGEARLLERTLAGTEAKGLELSVQASKELDYFVRKWHLMHGELHYAIEAYAPQAAFRASEKQLDDLLASFAFVEIPKSERERQALEELAAKCGSEIPWAADWAEAARRASEEQKLVLVSANLRQGFAIADQAMSGPFMDPDIVALARERFVCLKFGPSSEAPFRAQTSYGMGPHAFGVALFVVSAEGEVLEQFESMDALAVDRFLQQSLAKHVGRQLLLDGTPVGNAKWCVARGQLEDALQSAGLEDSPPSHALRAHVLRRLGDAQAALAEIDKATKSPDLERARILMQLGRCTDALAELERLPASPEALYLRGACEFLTGKKERARSSWETLVREHPEDRWAWVAAAHLAGPLLAIEAHWQPRAIDAEALRTLRDVPVQLLPAERFSDARQGAIDFLLREQRADGSWSTPSEVRGFDVDQPDPFVDATTALAGEALAAVPNAPLSRAAAERALGFLLRSIARAKSSGSVAGFMDYEVWSRSCTLRFLARCVDAKIGEPGARAGAARWLVAELKGKVRPGGGWSYYLTTDVTSTNAQDQQSISFVVAAVTLALQRAEETKLAEAKELLSGSLGCLERLRGEDGCFAYMIGAEDHAPKLSPTPAGDAGRGPACELALLHGKRSDVARLAGALSRFREHASGLMRESGKVLMHCGPEGQGCHYILFDLWTAALAARELPEKERGPYRTLLLESLMLLRSEEGGFRDTPILGWNTGTALALLALESL